MPQPELDLDVFLTSLSEAKVDCIIVGGVCASLHGAPLITHDLDIVPSRDPENLVRLENVLTALQAYYREHPPGRIRPTAQRLDTPGHHLLSTQAGWIDILGSISGNRDYAQLKPHTIEIVLTEEKRISILDLPMLIQTKEEAGRDKDKLALPVLRATLKEQERLREENK